MNPRVTNNRCERSNRINIGRIRACSKQSAPTHCKILLVGPCDGTRARGQAEVDQPVRAMRRHPTLARRSLTSVGSPHSYSHSSTQIALGQYSFQSLVWSTAFSHRSTSMERKLGSDGRAFTPSSLRVTVGREYVSLNWIPDSTNALALTASAVNSTADFESPHKECT